MQNHYKEAWNNYQQMQSNYKETQQQERDAKQPQSDTKQLQDKLTTESYKNGCRYINKETLNNHKDTQSNYNKVLHNHKETQLQGDTKITTGMATKMQQTTMKTTTKTDTQSDMIRPYRCASFNLFCLFRSGGLALLYVGGGASTCLCLGGLIATLSACVHKCVKSKWGNLKLSAQTGACVLKSRSVHDVIDADVPAVLSPLINKPNKELQTGEYRTLDCGGDVMSYS